MLKPGANERNAILSVMCSGYDKTMDRVWDNNNRGVRISQIAFSRVQMLTAENSANGRTSGTSTSRVAMMSRRGSKGHNENNQDEEKDEGTVSTRSYGSFTRVHSVMGAVVENRALLADNNLRFIMNVLVSRSMYDGHERRSCLFTTQGSGTITLICPQIRRKRRHGRVMLWERL